MSISRFRRRHHHHTVSLLLAQYLLNLSNRLVNDEIGDPSIGCDLVSLSLSASVKFCSENHINHKLLCACFNRHKCSAYHTATAGYAITNNLIRTKFPSFQLEIEKNNHKIRANETNESSNEFIVEVFAVLVIISTDL